MPKDTLGILWFEKDSILKIPLIKSFKISKEGDWIAYLSTMDNRPDCPSYKKWNIFKKRKKCTKLKTAGHTLTLINPLCLQAH